MTTDQLVEQRTADHTIRPFRADIPEQSQLFSEEIRAAFRSLR